MLKTFKWLCKNIQIPPFHCTFTSNQFFASFSFTWDKIKNCLVINHCTMITKKKDWKKKENLKPTSKANIYCTLLASVLIKPMYLWGPCSAGPGMQSHREIYLIIIHRLANKSQKRMMLWKKLTLMMTYGLVKKKIYQRSVQNRRHLRQIQIPVRIT